jgi:cytochrome P450
LDVHKEFMQLTLAIVCKALFGFDIESEAEEIGDYVTTLVEYFNRARMPLGELLKSCLYQAIDAFTMLRSS